MERCENAALIFQTSKIKLENTGGSYLSAYLTIYPFESWRMIWKGWTKHHVHAAMTGVWVFPTSCKAWTFVLVNFPGAASKTTRSIIFEYIRKHKTWMVLRILCSILLIKHEIFAWNTTNLYLAFDLPFSNRLIDFFGLDWIYLPDCQSLATLPNLPKPVTELP